MFLLKNGQAPDSRAQWSKLSCKTQPFKTVAKKYSSSDVSTLLLTDEKIFTTVTLKNLKNHQLYATAATKKEDFATKCLCTQSAFRQSLTAKGATTGGSGRSGPPKFGRTTPTFYVGFFVGVLCAVPCRLFHVSIR